MLNPGGPIHLNRRSLYTAYYYHPLGTAIHLHRIPLNSESLSDTLDPFYTRATHGSRWITVCVCIPVAMYVTIDRAEVCVLSLSRRYTTPGCSIYKLLTPARGLWKISTPRNGSFERVTGMLTVRTDTCDFFALCWDFWVSWKGKRCRLVGYFEKEKKKRSETSRREADACNFT